MVVRSYSSSQFILTKKPTYQAEMVTRFLKQTVKAAGGE